MRKRLAIPAALATAVLLLAGCATEPPMRSETIDFGAGDAIAANTVLQMVDPWPLGARDTRLAVPANREQYRKAPAEGEGAYAGEVMSQTNSDAVQ